MTPELARAIRDLRAAGWQLLAIARVLRLPLASVKAVVLDVAKHGA